MFNSIPFPYILVGEDSDEVILFIHGLHGSKEEALPFAEVAVREGYQVMGIDLDLDKKPWELLPGLLELRNILECKWKHIGIRADSIGCWMAMLAFQGSRAEKALFVSPILDMKAFIETMPQRDVRYYEWVCSHPISRWDAECFILRQGHDEIVDGRVGEAFIEGHTCRVTSMPGSGHWFHTADQLDFLRTWESVVLSRDVTEFRRKVYLELMNIPAGETISYKQLGERVGCRSAQAIGQAMKHNPFEPKVPCHRVIASDGSLGGFHGQRSGEMMERKARMLRMEHKEKQNISEG